MGELRSKNAEVENLDRELCNARHQLQLALEEVEIMKQKLHRLVSSALHPPYSCFLSVEKL